MSSPLSALPSSPLSTLSSPPASPTASTDNKEVSVRSQQFSYDSPTPRRNGNHARRTKTNQPYAATSNVGNNNEPTVDDVLTSPSWDVNNNTNFFRVGAAQPQPQQQQQLEAEPIGRSRSFWDRFAGGGFTAAGAAGGDGGGRSERPKPKGGSFETNSRGHSSEEEDSLLEAGENDLFAQEVGLMFSTDDGDTIRDENLFAQSLSMSMSRGLSASFSRSFAMDSASHRTPSDRLRVLTQGLRRESNNRHEHEVGIDDDSVGNNNYLQNTKYAVGTGPQPPSQLHQRTSSPRNDESEIMSIHTS
eukprot:scaffold9202_cov82-Skeletonema_dohrnii-CCMP3373.AAC.1